MSLRKVFKAQERTNLLSTPKIVEHLSNVSLRIQRAIVADSVLPESFQLKIVSDIQNKITSTISSIQYSKTVTEEELEGILFFDNPLINHETQFLETFFTELITDTVEFSMISLPALSCSLLVPSPVITTSISSFEAKALTPTPTPLQLPSREKSENDQFLTELFESHSLKEILKRFSLNLSSQEEFFAKFESFDRFQAKLDLFLYLGKRYCKIRNNPTTSSTWYSDFLASCPSVGLDNNQGKGDHGKYFYPTINLDGDYKRNYFKLFNQDTQDNINIENIYKEIHLKLSNFAKYEFDLSIQDRKMRQNFYQYMLDLNKVINELITKLLESSQLRKLYNI